VACVRPMHGLCTGSIRPPCPTCGFTLEISDSSAYIRPAYGLRMASLPCLWPLCLRIAFIRPSCPTCGFTLDISDSSTYVWPAYGLRTAYVRSTYGLCTASLPYLWLYSRNIRLLYLRTACIQPLYGLLALPVAPLPTYSLRTTFLPYL
jgi:endogenous inhibitor of DNA gyrase (YacG/DUF329 family)